MLRVMSTERMISLAIRWVLLSFAVWVAAEVVGGISHGGWDDIFVVALLLGLINLYIRPFLTFISLPLTLLTLGFFLLVLNAAFLGLAPWIAGWVNVQFHVEDFWAALFGAILISIVSMIVGLFIKPDRIARELTGG